MQIKYTPKKGLEQLIVDTASNTFGQAPLQAAGESTAALLVTCTACSGLSCWVMSLAEMTRLHGASLASALL